MPPRGFSGYPAETCSAAELPWRGRLHSVPFPAKRRYISLRGQVPRFMPRIRSAITDIDRRRFSKAAFKSIHRWFEEWTAELTRQNQGIKELDLTPVDATKFAAEIFVGGESRACCKIWIGGMMAGDDIAYARGQAALGSNSLNESLYVREVDGELVLSSIMGGAFGRAAEGLDLHRLGPEQAAEYLLATVRLGFGTVGLED